MQFYDPVRVPEDAGKGKAKVRLSFADWKEGKVAPAEFEVPIAESEPRNPQSNKEHQPPTVTGRQAGRELKLSAGLSTYVEGMALALLGTCSVRADESKDGWSKALESDHVRIVCHMPRPVGVDTGAGAEVLQVCEIVLPMSDREFPQGVLVRCGDRYQRYGKYWPQEAIRLQEFLKGLKKARR